MITKRAIELAAARISLMNYFPAGNPAAVAVLQTELAAMCATDEQVAWLAKRFTTLFPKRWPGMGELRAVFCSRYKPLDGIEGGSSEFPDGVPSERPEPAERLLAAPATGQLSADPEVDTLARELARAKQLGGSR